MQSRPWILVAVVAALAIAATAGSGAGRSVSPAAIQANVQNDIVLLRQALDLETAALNGLKSEEPKTRDAKRKLKKAMGLLDRIAKDLEGAAPGSVEASAAAKARVAKGQDDDAVDAIDDGRLRAAKKKIAAANKNKRAALEALEALPSGPDFGCVVGARPDATDPLDSQVSVSGCEVDLDEVIFTFPGMVTDMTQAIVIPLKGGTALRAGTCSGLGTTMLDCRIPVEAGNLLFLNVRPLLNASQSFTAELHSGANVQTVTVPGAPGRLG